MAIVLIIEDNKEVRENMSEILDLKTKIFMKSQKEKPEIKPLPKPEPELPKEPEITPAPEKQNPEPKVPEQEPQHAPEITPHPEHE